MSSLGLGELGFRDASKGVILGVARKNVTGLTFGSNVTPRIYVNDPLKPGGTRSRSMLFEAIKPSLTIHTSFGDQVIEPWGTPRSFPLVAAAAGAAALFLVWLAARKLA